MAPANRSETGGRARRPGICSFGVVDLADELDAGLVQQRCNLAPKVRLVDPIHLGRDLQRQADGAGDHNGPVDAFLR
jgi:hypothetical protein